MANLTLSEMLTIRNCLIKEVKENEKTVETAERFFPGSDFISIFRDLLNCSRSALAKINKELDKEK